MNEGDRVRIEGREGTVYGITESYYGCECCWYAGSAWVKFDDGTEDIFYETEWEEEWKI